MERKGKGEGERREGEGLRRSHTRTRVGWLSGTQARLVQRKAAQLRKKEKKKKRTPPWSMVGQPGLLRLPKEAAWPCVVQIFTSDKHENVC